MSDARWSASSGSHETDGAEEASAADRTQRIDRLEADDGVAATQSLPATGTTSHGAASGAANPFPPETAPTAWSAETGSAYRAQRVDAVGTPQETTASAAAAPAAGAAAAALPAHGAARPPGRAALVFANQGSGVCTGSRSRE